MQEHYLHTDVLNAIIQLNIMTLNKFTVKILELRCGYYSRIPLCCIAWYLIRGGKNIKKPEGSTYNYKPCPVCKFRQKRVLIRHCKTEGKVCPACPIRDKITINRFVYNVVEDAIKKLIEENIESPKVRKAFKDKVEKLLISFIRDCDNFLVKN